MDWNLSEEQQAAAGLAAQILGDKLTHERLKEIEASPERWAADEWRALADAGLVGLALPEEHGGAGLGILEAALVLEQVGRTVAPVPYLATVVMGALPIARFAPAELAAAWVPAAASGEVILSAALHGPPATAEPSGDGWSLRGEVSFVPFGAQAARVVVPVATPSGSAVVLVDPSARGVDVAHLRTTTGLPEASLRFDGSAVPAAEVVAPPGEGTPVVAWMRRHATVGVCAVAGGVAARAVELTGSYTSERHQFGSPIATFQAVAHRAADAYVDAAAIQLCTLHAAWRLSEGLPADDEIDVAKFWAAEGGQRVVHAAQHLHGGIGVDRDYPLHRYFLWAKVLELTLGGATERLAALGERIATAEVPA
jgi:alkylation response protein AidB-like acyl-CoA dehydrogenase